MKRLLLSIAFVIALPLEATDRWDLRSHFWVSLHQTLLASAQRDVDLDIPEEDRRAWASAANTYRIRFGSRSPYADEELMRLNDTLSSVETALPEAIGADVITALQTAAPIYRKRLWPSDDRANRFWITVARSLLADAGEELAAEHSRVYGVPFPARIRVDVTPFAGEYGAYTTSYKGMVHSTISSRDPAYQGFAALEILLHEPSHAIAGPTFGAIGPKINEEAARAGLLAPRQLWHAVIFYTTGELMKRALRARGVTDYTPIVYRGDMLDVVFRGIRGPLETHWQAFLNGTLTRDEAIANLVASTGIPPIPRVPGG